MGLLDLYQLSVMLKMQLPVLFSVAVLRWFAGMCTAFWCDLFLPTFARPHVKALGEFAVELRRYAFATSMLLLLACAARDPPRDLCGEYSSVRSQGISCAIALMMLVSCSSMLPLAISLATLKAVADTSAASLALVPAIGVAAFAPRKRHMVKYLAMFATIYVAYSVECYTDDKLTNRTGGPMLAVVLSAAIGMVRLLALLWSSGVHAMRAGMRMLVRVLSVRFGTASAKRAPTPPNTEESETETETEEEGEGEVNLELNFDDAVENHDHCGGVWEPPAPPCSPDLRKRPVGAGPGSEDGD